METPLFHHLLKILVFQFRLVDIDYFYNRMPLWEANDFIDYIPYLDRNSWEQARLNAYTTASIFSSKPIKMKDVVSFKWDDNSTEEQNIEITTQEINRLEAQAKLIEQRLRESKN